MKPLVQLTAAKLTGRATVIVALGFIARRAPDRFTPVAMSEGVQAEVFLDKEGRWCAHATNVTVYLSELNRTVTHVAMFINGEWRTEKFAWPRHATREVRSSVVVGVRVFIEGPVHG